MFCTCGKKEPYQQLAVVCICHSIRETERARTSDIQKTSPLTYWLCCLMAFIVSISLGGSLSWTASQRVLSHQQALPLIQYAQFAKKPLTAVRLVPAVWNHENLADRRSMSAWHLREQSVGLFHLQSECLFERFLSYGFLFFMQISYSNRQ